MRQYRPSFFFSLVLGGAAGFLSGCIFTAVVFSVWIS
jgi:hypothetical protein